MRTPDVYWHIYPQDQIHQRLRGHLLFFLAFPAIGGLPVLRDVADPTGRDFSVRPQIALVRAHPCSNSGIVFQGVSKPSVYGLLSLDPPIDPSDAGFQKYNRELVAATRRFYLIHPDHPWQDMPRAVVEMLSGHKLEPSLS
jgi:hypothetical protein